MFYRTEAKMQAWRALANFEDGSECLLYLGRSTTQVRGGYRTAFLEILDEEERARVRSVSLQCWQGAADEGRWLTKAALAIPAQQSATEKAKSADSDGQVLPFRRAASDSRASVQTSRKCAAPTA